MESDKPKLIVDGEAAKKTILDLIHESRHTIRIRMYMWRDDASGHIILDALQKKTEENPDVRIIIEKDAFGTRVYDFQRFITFGRMPGDIFSCEIGKNFLKNPNISFSLVGSSSMFLFRYLRENDHSKVFLFDEETEYCRALIGGMNISDDYLTAVDHENPDKGGWHDYMVLFHGADAQKIAFHKLEKKEHKIIKKVREGFEIMANIGQQFNLRTQILRELSNAKKEIIIEHGYITDRRVIRKLRKLDRKGIRITVIMPDRSDGAYDANMRSIYRILRPSTIDRHLPENISVYLYHGMIHAKVIVIDRMTAIIGSGNLTYGSFDLLHETNAIFRGKNGIVQDLLTELEKDISLSKKISLEEIPPHSRWLSWLQLLMH